MQYSVIIFPDCIRARDLPEIEMPGHAQAAIAAYPELGVTGEKVDVLTEWGVSPVIFNPSEETLLFLENILTNPL
jgi:hexosaminidase